jgi:hypothetical protein
LLVERRQRDVRRQKRGRFDPLSSVPRSLNPLATARRVAAVTDTVEAIPTEKTAALILDRVAVEESVNLSEVPQAARAEVLNAIQRAKQRKSSFTGHDGKRYFNRTAFFPVPSRTANGPWPVPRISVVCSG